MPTDRAISYETLSVEHHGGIDRLTLDRAEKLNAMNALMAGELRDYFDHLQHNESVRVVLLNGAGRHFCAGLDLDDAAEFSAGPPSGFRVQRSYAEIICKMRRCPQPIVALVHGAAAGAGFAIALAADVRYAADNARMNVAMSKVGLTGCDMGISYFLPRSIGASNAAELMMTGRFVDAHRALQIGLVSAIAPAEELADLGLALAQDMSSMSPLGLRFTKEGLNLAQDAGSLDAAIALEDRGQVLTLIEYFDEGVRAFKQRRAPNYGNDASAE